jgi:hypothetical protein
MNKLCVGTLHPTTFDEEGEGYTVADGLTMPPQTAPVGLEMNVDRVKNR